MKYPVNETYVKLLGRTSLKDGMRYLSYSCSGIEFEVVASKVEAILWTDGEKWGEDFKAWMAVFINDKNVPYKRFCLQQEEASYILYEGKSEEKVKIKLIKYSEAAFAKVGIKALEIEGQVPSPTSNKKLKIEFIGDSITCGYGNEGEFGKDHFTTAQENPYLAYAAQTAHTLQADYHLISWSGIGILSSWTDQNEINRKEQLMPKLYPYTNLALNEIVGEKEFWEFKAFLPDYIVIHLGTNDASYTKGQRARESAFEAVYYQFLLMVRMYNPQAYIICSLGGISTELYPVLTRAVESFKDNEKDTQIECLAFENQMAIDGIGTDSHPSLKTHQKMAKYLVQKIQELREQGY